MIYMGRLPLQAQIKLFTIYSVTTASLFVYRALLQQSSPLRLIYKSIIAIAPTEVICSAVVEVEGALVAFSVVFAAVRSPASQLE